MEIQAAKMKDESEFGPAWMNHPRFRIIPKFTYREADRHNTSRFGFDWLGFHIWTLDSPAVGAEIELNDLCLQASIRLPYLKAGFYLPLFPINYTNRFWRKSPRMGGFDDQA
jgi:hypothetical protein